MTTNTIQYVFKSSTVKSYLYAIVSQSIAFLIAPSALAYVVFISLITLNSNSSYYSD